MNKKNIVRTFIIIISIIVVTLLASSEYFLHYALHYDNIAPNEDECFKAHAKTYPHIANWIDSIRNTRALLDTTITKEGGIRLHAYMLHSSCPDNSNTAVIIHGYKNNAIQMMHIGYLYHQILGWNIILPDLYSHGQSDGKDIGMGWNDRLDVLKWIEIAHDTFKSDTMVVHGISMGAATTMCVAGEETPHYVRGFVEDCGYTSVWDEFSGELKNQFGLPEFPLMHLSNIVCKMQKGWSYKEASPLQQVKKCHKPMLFIHGGSDTYVPTWMVYPLYQAKPEPKYLWIAEGSEHAVSYLNHTDEYTQQVQAFVRNLQ